MFVKSLFDSFCRLSDGLNFYNYKSEGVNMIEHEMWEWDEQTAILKANGYTTEEINNRSFNDRHKMIRDNCDGCETDDLYDFNRDEHEQW